MFNVCAACGDRAPLICASCHSEIEELRIADSAVYVYDVPLRLALLRWKRGERPDLTSYFCAALPTVVADAVVPVPPALRVIWRGLHAPTELARATGLPLHRAALLRISQRRQMGKTRSQRTKPPRIVATPFARALQGKHVLLVDDVMTTGSTLQAASRALLGAGVAKVTPLALARADMKR